MRRALVVDDEELLRSLLEEMLAGAGWAVHVAADAAEALRCARDDRFDVALVDLHLDGPMDGPRLCRALRAAQADVALLLMSGEPDLDATARAGAQGFVAKPFRMSELLGALERAVGGV
ncbi:MAG: response regulator [Planctomycetota bacterium]|nr:response regulator [Planctomycetota bacterium]